MPNHQYMIETKSGGESRRAGLITPINGSSYCISETHLRVEVNTFVLVVIMARKAHLQRCARENFGQPDIEGPERSHICN